MIDNEPTFYNAIPPENRDEAVAISKDICQHTSSECSDPGMAVGYCEECDTPKGGDCIAFGLYGDIALAVIAGQLRRRSQP
jgi:hypothetical protein